MDRLVMKAPIFAICQAAETEQCERSRRSGSVIVPRRPVEKAKTWCDIAPMPSGPQ
jgi:hypothetical protein